MSEKSGRLWGAGNLAVVGSGFKKVRRFNPKKLPKNVLKVLAIILLVSAVAAGGFLYANHLREKQEAKIDAQKVNSLFAKSDCSDTAQQSVSKEQPYLLPKKGPLNPKQVDASISLLNYRVLCLMVSNKYQEANNVLEQIRNYYVAKHDIYFIWEVDSEIAANSGKPAPPPPQSSHNSPGFQSPPAGLPKDQLSNAGNSQ